MAHIHIAAAPGVTIDGFRAVAAKHNPPRTSTACSPGQPARTRTGSTW